MPRPIRQTSAERHPGNLAGPVATVAIALLVECFRKLPLLRFIAPLRDRVGHDVVGLAIKANRRGGRGLFAALRAVNLLRR